MSEKKLMLSIALIVGIGSQINLGYNIPGFIITLAVILLAVLIYIFDVIYYKTILLTAIISPLFRGLILFMGTKDLTKTVFLVSPDIIFYLTFGFIFWLMRHFTKKGLAQYVLTVFIADFISNIVEVSFRLTPTEIIDNQTLNYLFLVAIIRCLIVLLALILNRSYHFYLKREEHEDRYQKLLLLQSHFKSEIYFLEKNINAIEGIMKDAYQLHKIAQDDDIRDLSLEISKNIHEVKKDYIRVIDGLHELASPDDTDYIDSLLLSDLVDIILVNTREFLEKHNNRRIQILCNDLKGNYRVNKHYYLMSILRNLINNAIESIAEKGLIELSIAEQNDRISIEVKDNGQGIQSKNLDYIFNLGYSTKFVSGDGKSRRGMGLAIVKDLVENQFDGVLNVNSTLSKGSTFLIELPLDRL